ALHRLPSPPDPLDRPRPLVLRAPANTARAATREADLDAGEAAAVFRRAGLPPPTLSTLFNPAAAVPIAQ
ncbi:hypothetical protein ABZ319_40025, partial [Nocardia sp. NPDC005978]|uniref:hypothetical protein n=1 Tax=Nocardia sp. NPDC005978 TaxID=3156725 RepID=UPI0033B393AE